MITINTTVNQEIEGLRIMDPLEQKLMATLNDFEKSRRTGDFLTTYMALAVSIADGITIDQAMVYVTSNTERIS